MRGRIENVTNDGGALHHTKIPEAEFNLISELMY